MTKQNILLFVIKHCKVKDTIAFVTPQLQQVKPVVLVIYVYLILKGLSQLVQ